MKALAMILLTISLSIGTLSAQKKYIPKNTFKYGYGTSYLMTGEYFGKLQYLEYNRSLFRRISVGIIGSRIKADEVQPDGFAQKTLANQGELNLYLLPINNNTNSLKFGGGGVFRQMDYSTMKGDQANEDWMTTRTEQYGFSASLEYEVYIAKHITLGSKASFQQFQDKDRVYSWGLNFGLRF